MRQILYRLLQVSSTAYIIIYLNLILKICNPLVEYGNEESVQPSREIVVESEYAHTNSIPASQIADSEQGNIDASAGPVVEAIGQIAAEKVDDEAQIPGQPSLDYLNSPLY